MPESVNVKKEVYGNIPYYYIHGNCKYECEYKGDAFYLTNGGVEMSKMEEKLIKLNATKYYYSIKLNQQGEVDITIPEVEEKLYTEEEVLELLDSFQDDLTMLCETQGYNTKIWLNSKKK